MEENIQDLFHNPSYNLLTLLDKLNIFFTSHINHVDSIDLISVDLKLVEEVKKYGRVDNVRVYYGKTIRDIKCVIEDDDGRKHDILIYCSGPNKLQVTFSRLPSHLIHRDYDSLDDIIKAFTMKINELSSYFYQLEQIDQLCLVKEPINPTFGDNYRRISLDDRTWLHVEVTADGLATNIHLVGNTKEWQSKLQKGLLKWDHDKNIVENILTLFELSYPSLSLEITPTKEDDEISVPTCSICLCVELPGLSGLPQPLCKNYACGVFFHQACLYQWLIMCGKYRQPAFDVATGLCPSCFHPIDCIKDER